MTDIALWTDNFIKALDEAFGERIWFIGLQGSRARGEATEKSDIDTVVILDNLTAEDIRVYNGILDGLPERELLCGFISGKNELLNWEPSDLFQFYYDTVPLKGSLSELLELIDSEAVKKAVKLGVCNIYHGCVHNMLYEKSDEILKGLYKAASFTVQAIVFLETGNYIKRLNDLENLALSYPGVVKTYAIQAGRELRVIVGADKLSDQESESLSHDIAKKIQDEMTYPGQVKITVIRETRSVSYAK